MLRRPLVDAITRQYIVKLGQQVAPTTEEAEYVMSRVWVSYQDYTAVMAHAKVLDIVSRTVSRTNVGRDLCRNPDWLTASLGYAHNVMTAAIFMKRVPEYARPLVAVVTPHLYRSRRHRLAIRRLVLPLVEQKMAWRRDKPESWRAHLKTDETTSLDWLIETTPPEEMTADMIAHRLLGIVLASIHTTSNTISNALMNLASDFDRWAPDLRQEIATGLGSRSIKDVSNVDLSRMWLLDSFLKESQRRNPVPMNSTYHTVTQLHIPIYMYTYTCTHAASSSSN